MTETFWQKLRRRTLKTIFVIGAVLGFLVLIILLLALGQPAAKAPFTLGATYRYPSAQALGLDWKKTYVAAMEDLHIKNWRIPAYWEELEKQRGQIDFSNLDFQMREAGSNGAGVILAIGRRVPGWPECHIPDWAAQENMDQQQRDLIDLMTAEVNRYKNDPALKYWQIENEPFLLQFGTCPKYPVAQYLDQEIKLVRSLDPNHQIIVTDSGELSIWIRAADRADIFGSTLYRKVYAQHFHRYIDYHWPAIIFKAKEGFVRLFNPHKPIVNIELQAEPWTTKGITNTSFEEQAITYPPGSLTDNVAFARKSGFSTSYLWGVEYWYYAAAQGHPEFLNEARQVINSVNNQQ